MAKLFVIDRNGKKKKQVSINSRMDFKNCVTSYNKKLYNEKNELLCENLCVKLKMQKSSIVIEVQMEVNFWGTIVSKKNFNT